MTPAEVVSGILQRALEFVVKTLAPEVATELGGPFGVLLKAVLETDYAKGLEDKVLNKADTELQQLQEDCQSWLTGFLEHHPAAKEFWTAVKPPPGVQFSLKDDELAAILKAQGDGTLRAKLGLQ